MRSFLWHLFYWLLPLLATISVIAATFIGFETWWLWVQSPTGFLEASVLIAGAPALIYCAIMLRREEIWGDITMRSWLLAYCVAIVYFVGEDHNWGQYWFNLNVPEFLLENNKEHEINLHNISGWFNQKPRLIVEIWIIVVGILVPMEYWTWPKKISKSFVPEIFWPDRQLVPMAIITTFFGIFARLIKQFPVIELEDIRFSEVHEMMIAYFMLLYAYMLKTRTDPHA